MAGVGAVMADFVVLLLLSLLLPHLLMLLAAACFTVGFLATAAPSLGFWAGVAQAERDKGRAK